MRAFVAKSLVIASLVTIPAIAEAQLSKLLGIKKAPSSEAVRTPIRPVQFEDLLPEALPPAGEEASGVAPGSVNEAVQGLPVPPADNVVTELLPPSEVGVMEYPIVGEPIVSGPATGETIMEPGIGQPYDLPIANVIPEVGADTFSTNNWFRGGRWYSKQEFVMLLRTDLPQVHVALDGSETTIGGVPVLDPFVVAEINTKQADFTYEAGTRLSLGRILGRDVANRDHGIEFTFFGLFDYAGRSALVPADINSGAGITTLLGSRENGSVQSLIQSGIPFGFPVINIVDGFTNAVSQDILYEADLNSLEFNYMISGRPSRDRLVLQPDGRWTRFATPSRVRSLFVGLRYVRQNESFLYNSRGNNRVSPIFDDDGNTVGFFSDPTDEAGRYRVTTDNDLFGLQVGSEVVQKRTDWVVGLKGKIGGLVNFADRHSRLNQRFDNLDDPNDDDNFTTRETTQSLDDETLTFLGEATAYVAYYLRPNTSVQLGYNVLYLNGMATATNNIGLLGDPFPRFELTGDSLYHGLNVGFEMTW